MPAYEPPALTPGPDASRPLLTLLHISFPSLLAVDVRPEPPSSKQCKEDAALERTGISPWWSSAKLLVHGLRRRTLTPGRLS
ncbi:hypothetical protein B0H14DRAFT_1062638 [Mycena olivaceomarginata]|nr:hypothetical protein B0H14DRAFT_1062638 [Mycena olivaceomarginata]